MHIERTLDTWCLFYHRRLPCLQWQSATVRITISSLAGFESISMGSSRHWRSTFSILISHSDHRPHDQWFLNALSTMCLQINLSTLLLYPMVYWFGYQHETLLGADAVIFVLYFPPGALNYSHVIWASSPVKSPATRMLLQNRFQGNNI